MPEPERNQQIERTNSALRPVVFPPVRSTEKGRIDVMRPTGRHINDLLRPMGWTSDSLEARLFIENEYVKDAILECSIPRPRHR